MSHHAREYRIKIQVRQLNSISWRRWLFLLLINRGIGLTFPGQRGFNSIVSAAYHHTRTNITPQRLPRETGDVRLDNPQI